MADDTQKQRSVRYCSTETTQAHSILVVSTDESFVANCERHLSSQLNGEIRSVETVEQALEVLHSDCAVDCLISDHDLPEMDGVAFLEAVRVQYPRLPFILFTSEGDESVASRAISADVTEYLIKEKHTDQWERLATLIENGVAYAEHPQGFADEETRTKTVLDAVHDTVAVVQDETVTYINQSGVQLLEFADKESVRDRSVKDVFQRTDGRPLTDLLKDIESTRLLLDRTEIELRNQAGGVVPVELTATRIEWRGTPAVLLIVRSVRDKRTYRAELQQFKRAVEAAGHAIYITDADGTITYVNPAFERTTGYDREDALGRTPELLKSGEMDDEYYERLWQTITDGDIWEEEIINQRQSDDLYHANQTIAPILDDDGDVWRFVAIQTDITERKELERELKQYREVIQRLDDPIMMQNRDGEYELFNEAVTEFSGYSRDELLGEDESLFMDEETAAFIEKKKREVIEDEIPVEYEVAPEFEQTDQSPVFRTRRSPYYDENGDLVGTLAICRDITTLKRREEHLRQYERAITGATDLIAAIDRNGQYLFANPQYCEYHEIEQNDVTELTVADVFDDPTYRELMSRLERVLDGHTVQYRTTRQHPVKGERTLDVRHYPLWSGDEVTGVVGVIRDVTDTTNRSIQLQVVDRVLRHNLRNDLTAIRLRAEEIRSDPDGDAMALAAGIIEKVDRLLTTSDKSRDITDILAEQPHQQAVTLDRRLRHLVAGLSEQFPNAELSVSSPENVVVSATDYIDQAIEELVTNAIVHNDQASPSVQIHVTLDESSVMVAVTDDGPGLPEMDRDVLEEGRESDELYHGSGLGLWLVYWIVHRSGGSVTVKDAEPRGTTVRITLQRHDEN